jgi:exonuclease III
MVNRIVVWNANGVKEKINDLTLLATTKRPKIIAITETHLSPDHDTTPFKIHDYNLLSFPSTKPSAGIIIYVHYSLHTTHRTDLSTPPNSDLTSAVQTIQFHRKLSNHRSEPTLLAITYIHPNSGFGFGFGFTDELRVIEPRIQRANEC